MSLRIVAMLVAGLVSAAPALAVGLGPLTADGVTAGDRKGFYLTLINPYPTREPFRVYGIGWADEAPAVRVRLPIDTFLLPSSSQRRILVIATDLAPGETYHFRVCAERADPNEKAIVNARVCSKLSASRVG